jgi:catalase
MSVPQGRANYEPNSLDERGEPSGPRECPATGIITYPNAEARDGGHERVRVRPALFADHFSQARMFYRSQTPAEQAHLASALVFELAKVTLDHVRLKVLALLGVVDTDLAFRVAAGLTMPLPAPAETAAPVLDMAPSPALSIVGKGLQQMAGRTVAILFAEDSSRDTIVRMRDAIEAQHGRVVLVSQRTGLIPVRDGSLRADAKLEGSPSALFDAVASIIPPEALAALRADHAVRDWFADAYAHCKTIGACPATLRLLGEWGIAADEGVTNLQDFPHIAPARHWAREPRVRLLA